jgi:hypothetical protein
MNAWPIESPHQQLLLVAMRGLQLGGQLPITQSSIGGALQ